MTALLLAVLLAPGPRRAADPASDPSTWGRVTVAHEEVRAPGVREADQRSLLATLVGLHEAWLRQDREAYLARVEDDVAALGHRQSEPAHGRAALGEALARQWEACERPRGVIAMALHLRRLELVVEGDLATARYWLEAGGGARWEFDDQLLTHQVFRRRGEGWRLLHHTDAGSLAFDLDEEQAGAEETRGFAFVYPVRDLARAVAFYTPLLGEPEFVGRGRASFHLRGHRFLLEDGPLGGRARVRPGLPNGYAVFTVADLGAERRRLEREEVELAETEAAGPDRRVVAEDPAGNVFVLQQERWAERGRESAAAPPALRVEGGRGPWAEPVERLLGRWLRTDARGVAELAGGEPLWFDDTRSRTRGVARGRAEVVAALEDGWKRRDRTRAGLRAEAVVDRLHAMAAGARTLVSYRLRLTGTGAHPYRDVAFVTHVFTGAGEAARALESYLVTAATPPAMAIELDYTGYPVPSVEEIAGFYTDTLGFGKPYRDTGWRGWWFENAVFGVYAADADEDGLPRAGRANGYASFWVRDAQEVYDYLRGQGAGFPVIPAINGKRGLDRQPGYRQVVASDSEGNVLLFTEYGGQ